MISSGRATWAYRPRLSISPVEELFDHRRVLGRIPDAGTPYRLAEGGEAIRALIDRQATGKLVLTME